MVKLTYAMKADTASSNSNKMPVTVNENRCTQKFQKIVRQLSEERTRTTSHQYRESDTFVRSLCASYGATCIRRGGGEGGRGTAEAVRQQGTARIVKCLIEFDCLLPSLLTIRVLLLCANFGCFTRVVYP